MNTTVTTITHIAKPSDARCAWWQCELPLNLEVKHLIEKAPFEYFKKNSDLELTPGTLLIDSEAIHHRTNRGFAVNIGLVGQKGIYWLCPTMAHKQLIKKQGHADLMVGSGDICAVIRIAIWLRRQENIFVAFDQLQNTK
jgi:hypothetical protein